MRGSGLEVTDPGRSDIGAKNRNGHLKAAFRLVGRSGGSKPDDDAGGNPDRSLREGGLVLADGESLLIEDPWRDQRRP